MKICLSIPLFDMYQQTTPLNPIRVIICSQGYRFSINPNPFFIRMGFNLHPKPLSPLQGRGLTENHGRPLIFRLFWYGSRAFAPPGFAILSTSLLTPPLEKGLSPSKTFFDKRSEQARNRTVLHVFSGIIPRKHSARGGL